MVSIEVTTDPDDETSSPTIDLGAPDLMLEGSVDRVNLERCIEQLPAGYRAIFILHDVQGFQHTEIAAIVGRSVGDRSRSCTKLACGCGNFFTSFSEKAPRWAPRRPQAAFRVPHYVVPFTANNA